MQEKNIDERKKAIQECMLMWNKYGKSYRAVIDEYLTLRENCLKLGVKPSKKIKYSRIRAEFVDLPFMYETKECYAKAALSKLSTEYLKKLPEIIKETMTYNVIYNTLSSYNLDMKARIKKATVDNGYTTLAGKIDPGYTHQGPARYY